MKFYLSYWSGGYRKEPDKLLIDMHKLSAYYINKHYGECHLITDSTSKPYFLNLPFTSITTELDEIKNTETENWALGKLLAYRNISNRKEPFIHIDYDVFLLKKLPDSYLNSGVLVQSVEEDVYDCYRLDVLKNHIPSRYNINPEKTDIAYNVGIFGGTNYNFIHSYSTKAIELCMDSECKIMFDIQSNETKRDKALKSPGFGPACTCEQYYLWVLSQASGVDVTCLLPGSNKRKEEREKKTNELGYVHLMSNKNKPNVVLEMYNKIKYFETEILI